LRNTSLETREILLNGVKRIAENMGRVAGLPEDKLPEVIISEDGVPPTVNEAALTRQLKEAWARTMGDETVVFNPTKGMGAEDFPFLTSDPEIPSVYWAVGGTLQEDFDREAAGGPPVPSHHSPLFKIVPEPSVRVGVESTVVALLELMGN
jgi:hippurate hydrolase